MLINILWSGVMSRSLESCAAKLSLHGAAIHSTIVGATNKKIYSVAYHISTNENWETTFVKIEWTLNEQKFCWQLEKMKDAGWLLNGKPQPDLDDCLDIDIAVSPLTNTLPINRLHFTDGSPHEITVIYCNPLANEIRKVRQRYTRLHSGKYRYENVPKDFEAEIQVDEFGLVIDYPQLFIREQVCVNDFHN